MHKLLAALREIVGAAHVLTEGDLSAWEQDWRKRAQGRALAVVRPGSTPEVAAVVKGCAAFCTANPGSGVSLVAQGGNTGLVVGATPDATGRQLVLSLQRMNRIRHLDPDNLTLTAEAGCILQYLQQHSGASNLLLPLSLAAEGTCTIGGNLATNAGGTQVLRYGNARELCLGLEVVTAHGEVWHGLSGLRKDNTGYDLRNLFIGSEGTLGIITAATMKLYPMPAARLTAWVTTDSLDQAVKLLALAQRQLGPTLSGFEVMGQFALSLVVRHLAQLRLPLPLDSPWCVLLECSDHESETHARVKFEKLLEAAFDGGHISNAALAESIHQADQMWQIRESIPLAQPLEGLNIKHDISVAVSQIAEFVRATDALLQQEIPGVRLVNFGHLGDGNLHYNVQAPVGVDAAMFLHEHEERVNTLVFDSVVSFGGSISAEHGVGSLKVEQLEIYKSPVALELMRAIKRALDPQNLLNPGRVIRV